VGNKIRKIFGRINSNRHHYTYRNTHQQRNHVGVEPVKTSSCKGKGRRLQQYVRDVFRKKYEASVASEDIESRGMGQSGTDLILSPLAKQFIKYDIECKNTETINIWNALAQAEANTKPGRIPLLIFKRNHSEVYACLKLSDLL
jgi:hypothetical protein